MVKNNLGEARGAERAGGMGALVARVGAENRSFRSKKGIGG
jgi:hypothetical protein